jgi:voltage-gated potassium channel
MNALARSPLRNLVIAVAFVLAVVGVATLAYMGAGWSFDDAVYMVLLTVYTVGYGEVHPISTPYLHAVTIATMVFGCTGMILVTSVLVQALTASQIQQLLGSNRVKNDIEKLRGHIIVCGFGRMGVMLAKDLAAPWVISRFRATPRTSRCWSGPGWSTPASWPRSCPTTRPTFS